MIVRISNDGQYELDDSDHAELNELDDAVVTAVDADDEDGFHERYEALLRFVRERGRQVSDDDLRPSEFILPPADLTFAEAREAGHFEGEGLIPEPDPTPDAA
jgi:hypothetical protein